MKLRLFTLVSVCVVIFSCASNPDDIQAAYVSPLQYASFDCNQLSQEMGYVGQRTNVLYQNLRQERNADNWQMGLGLLIFWPTLFALEGGDGPEATEYAQLQGEFEALRVNSVDKSCNISARSPDEILTAAAEADNNNPGNDAPVGDRLSELNDLREQGLISEEEYQAARQRALGI